MKLKSVIISPIMKVPKKIYLVAAVLLFAGGAGTVLALQPEPAIKKVAIEQASSSTPVVKSAAVETPAPVSDQPASAPVPTPTPPPTAPATNNPYVKDTNLWYVWQRLYEEGHTIPAWGDIGTWSTRAVAEGKTVSHDPVKGSIAQMGNRQIGIVEEVNADGTVLVWMGPNDTTLLTGSKIASTYYIYL